ncbi:MAG TPA: metallophosphoesterase, partial [Candidatus Lustribacter sp.]|nr:metallophosphoesterase [Candidatus Lustribacter sp.]
LGDIDLRFDSPLVAPGVDASVSVKESITDLFATRTVSVDAIKPTPAEVDAALGAAIRGVGLRFLTGALIVAFVLSVAVQEGRRRRPSRRHLVAVGSALALTCGGMAAAVAGTYRQQRFASSTSTGVLQAVQRNAGLLGSVETRAEQAVPYVRNLIALSAALQDKFVPTDLSAPESARLLLVSDLHGANSYALMRSVIAEERIDAVVDSGDLINFGSATEAESAGIFAGIASLGVPYVFVGGNHDLSSPADGALLARLARVPNVVLLQPGKATYTVYSLNGLRVAGFNDPRYFGDDAKDTAAKQQPAVEAFNLAMAGQPVLDLAVSHEPAGAAGIERAVARVHGHLHRATLDGSLIGVGSFTGGGLALHFVDDGDAELTEQPYAFDVAAFGSTCRLTSLTRYSYRNLISGRPAYDNVTIVNGATIADRAADAGQADGAPATEPGRACSRSLGVSRTTVPGAAGGGGG